MYPYGGGLKVYEASVELYNVRLTNNKAEGQFGLYRSYGGGIYSEESYLRLEDCELDHNTSDASSAIHMKGDNWSTDILSSTIHHNIVSKYETFAGHIHLENELVMTNSTMSDNQGGDFNIVVNEAPALIQHSTLISSGELGSIDSQSGNLELWFNILQVIPIPGDNQGIVCSVPFIARPSLGGNIFSDDTCRPGANDAVIPYSDMFLGPLGNYGGITPTIPLRPRSPAVNYKVFDCTNAYGSRLWVDQREKSRNDNRCDPGSFELQAGENPTVVYLPLIAK